MTLNMKKLPVLFLSNSNTPAAIQPRSQGRTSS